MRLEQKTLTTGDQREAECYARRGEGYCQPAVGTEQSAQFAQFAGLGGGCGSVARAKRVVV